MSEDSMEGLTAILEQFRSLHSEIVLRIKQHTQLVIFKIVSLGAAVSFIVEKTGAFNGNSSPDAPNVGRVYLWLVPLVAVGFYMLISGNLRVLYNIGPFIRDGIEPVFRHFSGPGICFWEETVASGPKCYHCYRLRDLALIWLFSLAPFALVFFIRLDQGWGAWDCFGGGLSVLAVGYSALDLYFCIRMTRKYPKLLACIQAKQSGA